MIHSSFRSLAWSLVIACSVALACSFQVPDEDKVFSSNAVGGQGSGGITGNAGSSSNYAHTGGSSANNGGSGGSGGVAGTATSETGLGGAGGATGSSTGGAGGGTRVTGGSPATGGAANPGGTGGTNATGGVKTTGGASGGAIGGATSTGGNNATGGASATTGGSLGAGGTGGATTSTATGGVVSTGGSSGSGGSTATAASGGTPGTGGNLATGGNADVLSIGLVHNYKFDETSGTVAVDSIDPTKNGTYMGSCSHVAAHFGRGVQMRNAGSTDYVELAPGLLSGLSATTISIWFLDLSVTRRGARVFDFGTGDPTDIFFVPQVSNPSTLSDAGLVAIRSNGLTSVQLWDNVNLADAVWHHMAATWDIGAVNFYIDGNLIGTQATPGVLPSDLSATAPNWLGRTFNDAAPLMYATLDDLRIYDRVLPLLYIQSLYNML